MSLESFCWWQSAWRFICRHGCLSRAAEVTCCYGHCGWRWRSDFRQSSTYCTTHDPWRSCGDLLYMGQAHYPRTVPRRAARIDAPANESLLNDLKRWQRIWLISAPTSLRPREILPGSEIVSTWEEPTLGKVFLLKWHP